jgi:16S rRNA (adenine1518-N6/adenine1519-N6)-dimethyltransferase
VPATEPQLPPLREVIARYGLGARKSLGQHFLLDANLTDRIVRSANLDGIAAVLEIGPGPGGLTRSLLATPVPRIVAVERDPRCLEALADLANAYPGRLDVVAGDAMTVDERALLPANAAIVSNLPYNIGTALLFKWLENDLPVRSMTLLFQKEVVERIVAEPRTKAYGRLAVMTQWRCIVRKLFDIPARAFTPPPKVVSSLVQLTLREQPLAPAEGKTLARIVAAAFGQRRKMLRASLRKVCAEPEAILKLADIDGTRRAEELTIEEFCALSRAYQGVSEG